MRRTSHAIAAGALAGLLALAGCAGDNLPAPAKRPKAPPANAIFDLHVNGRSATIEFGSPGLISGDVVHVSKDCRQRSLAPALAWGAVPFGTAELALFVLQLPKSSRAGISLQWAAAGINPTVRNIGAGQLPPGAIVSSQSHRPFFSCPRRDTTAAYLFLLYGLPTRHVLRQGFDDTGLFVSTYNSPTPFGAFVLKYARA